MMFLHQSYIKAESTADLLSHLVQLIDLFSQVGQIISVILMGPVD